MKTIKTTIFLIIIAALMLIAYAYSGWYNVAAGTGHTPLVRWYLDTVRDRSIERRSADLAVPANLFSPGRVRTGAGHYQEMCQDCHGHPGREPAEVFDPRPPALYRDAEDPTEIFWAVKHGIKMSAMPSHTSHTDEEIWDIVSFVRQLPDLDQQAYEELMAEVTHRHDDESSSKTREESTGPQADQANDESAEQQQGEDSAGAHEHDEEKESSGDQVRDQNYRRISG